MKGENIWIGEAYILEETLLVFTNQGPVLFLFREGDKSVNYSSEWQSYSFRKASLSTPH